MLEGVRRWLEPLPDKSLPALNIQQEFFRTLPELKFIDASVLKESGLGRIVLFYTKCKRVTPEVTRAANDLISRWSRPIIKRSASYRDRVVPVAGGELDGRPTERLNQILARAREEDKTRVRRNHVMIPHREGNAYTIAPRAASGLNKTNASVDVDIQRRKANAERLRALTRKVTAK
jgi:transcription factor SPN1